MEGVKLTAMVEVIRKIVNAELNKLHFSELGVVTSIFPHSSGSDNDNYECNVKLKNSGLELRKVPIITHQIGLANTPKVGDLVLVNFLNVNINSPIVVGRLYNDEDRPPQNNDGEVIYIPPYSQNSALKRIHVKLPSGIEFTMKDDNIDISAGNTKMKLNRDGDVTIESNARISIKAKGDMSLSATNIKIESQARLEIKAGATANIEASAPLTLKGATVNIN